MWKLFRKVDHLPRVEMFEPVEWLIDRFVLVESSTQAQLLIPIVASLVFGLASATLFSILLVPAFFMILQDWTKLDTALAES